MQETGSSVLFAHEVPGQIDPEADRSNFNLFIYLNPGEITFALSRRKTHEFSALESWELVPDKDVAESIKQVFTDSRLIQSSRKCRVICSSGFREQVFIPNALFHPDTYKDQFSFANNTDQSDEIYVEEIPHADAKNVFAVPHAVIQVLNSFFQNPELHHTATSMISQLLLSGSAEPNGMMAVIMHKNYFEAIVIRNRQFIFYNSFDYDSPEELVYYLLFICEQLRLNPEQLKLHLAGRISENDPNHSLITRYFVNPGFLERPEGYHYESGFDSLKHHLHFNLYSLPVCVS